MLWFCTTVGLPSAANTLWWARFMALAAL